MDEPCTAALSLPVTGTRGQDGGASGLPAISPCYYTVRLASSALRLTLALDLQWFRTGSALNVHCHCIGTAGVPMVESAIQQRRDARRVVWKGVMPHDEQRR